MLTKDEYEAAPCVTRPKPSPGSQGVFGKRILLADDEPAVRETMKLLLGLDAHTVVEAVNGREALNLFTKESFDLVITDYAMPVMKGDELASGIKRLSPSQPILMITGSANNDAFVVNPVDALLNKPFTLTELRESIAGVLAAVA